MAGGASPTHCVRVRLKPVHPTRPSTSLTERSTPSILYSVGGLAPTSGKGPVTAYHVNPVYHRSGHASLLNAARLNRAMFVRAQYQKS